MVPRSQSKEFGNNAKFFKHDLGMTKQLLSAAGYPNGRETTFTTYRQPRAALSLNPPMDVVLGMIDNSGLFRYWRQEVDFSPTWLTDYHAGKANFKGVAFVTNGFNFDPPLFAFQMYNSKGSFSQATDSTLDDMTAKALQEFDTAKRQSIIHDIQRYDGGKQFFVRTAGYSSYTLNWPIVRNFNVFGGGTQGGGTSRNAGLVWYWLDPTKQPGT
jgi:ABC-type transport system substrate-binding protein